MVNEKKQKFNLLIDKMSCCQKCINIVSKKGNCMSLINIYKNPEFAKRIPSIWTDWYNRLDAKIMVVGQDWGPFTDMEKLNKLYIKDMNVKNWKFLIETENSLTKRKLIKFLIESSLGKLKNIDDIYITNAIMCARRGVNYRADNIDLKKCSFNCGEYLFRQIEIVKPKIILTLGYYPLLSLSRIFNFDIGSNLKETMERFPFIKTNEYIIIPMYHPVAQVSNEEQIKRYKLIWELL